MNPILSILGGGNGGNIFGQILMQAIGAAIRGETPQQFLKGLAKTRPELRGVDLDDLEGSARSIAQQKGVDFEAVKGQALSTIQKYV